MLLVLSAGLRLALFTRLGGHHRRGRRRGRGRGQIGVVPVNHDRVLNVAHAIDDDVSCGHLLHRGRRGHANRLDGGRAASLKRLSDAVEDNVAAGLQGIIYTG